MKTFPNKHADVKGFRNEDEEIMLSGMQQREYIQK